MDPNPKYSAPTKTGFSLVLLFALLPILILPFATFRKYKAASDYSAIASVVAFVISVFVASALAERDGRRSIEIQPQRIQTEAERLTEINRSPQIQLERPYSNTWSQIQAERTERSRISPNFYRQIARHAVTSLRNLPPLQSYKGSNKIEGSRYQCAVCLEEFKIGELVQPFPKCNHQFHASCINSWLLGGKNTCPTCRCSLQG